MRPSAVALFKSALENDLQGKLDDTGRLDRLDDLLGRWRRHRPSKDLAVLFLWALAQQFVLQTVLLRELRKVLAPYAAVTAAAAVFALLHAPNPFLVPATFAGGRAWCWIYTRHPNVLPLALSHSLAALMILAW